MILSLIENFGPLITMEPQTFGCILCERDIEVKTLLTFSSTTSKYQLLVSQVAYDYLSWTSICSSKLFTIIVLPGHPLFREIFHHDYICCTSIRQETLF